MMPMPRQQHLSPVCFPKLSYRVCLAEMLRAVCYRCFCCVLAMVEGRRRFPITISQPNCLYLLCSQKTVEKPEAKGQDCCSNKLSSHLTQRSPKASHWAIPRQPMDATLSFWCAVRLSYCLLPGAAKEHRSGPMNSNLLRLHPNYIAPTNNGIISFSGQCERRKEKRCSLHPAE